jgi:hypothetical protein
MVELSCRQPASVRTFLSWVHTRQHIRFFELVIRMAVGATPRDVLLLVGRQAAVWTSVGVRVGAGTALVLSQLLGSILRCQ